MNQQTAEALHELVKVAAKFIGYKGEIIATVCNPKIPVIKENCNHKGRKLIDFNEQTFEATYFCRKCKSTWTRKPKFVCGDVNDD